MYKKIQEEEIEDWQEWARRQYQNW